MKTYPRIYVLYTIYEDLPAATEKAAKLSAHLERETGRFSCVHLSEVRYTSDICIYIYIYMYYIPYMKTYRRPRTKRESWVRILSARRGDFRACTCLRWDILQIYASIYIYVLYTIYEDLPSATDKAGKLSSHLERETGRCSCVHLSEVLDILQYMYVYININIKYHIWRRALGHGESG